MNGITRGKVIEACRENGIGEIEIGQGAMGNTRLAFFDNCHVIIVDKIGVGQHRLFAKQAKVVQAHRVMHAVPLNNIVMLPVAFRAVALYMTFVFPGQLRQAF